LYGERVLELLREVTIATRTCRPLQALIEIVTAYVELTTKSTVIGSNAIRAKEKYEKD